MVFECKDNNVDQRKALIYKWEIISQSGELMGFYVGKAKDGASRPLNDYKLNVTRILLNKPYRKSNPTGFRRIHRALAEAVKNSYHIQLELLCNIGQSEDINTVEHYWIEHYKNAYKNGNCYNY